MPAGTFPFVALPALLRVLLLLMLAATVSCSPSSSPPGPPWLAQLLSHTQSVGDDSGVWGRIVAAAAADPAHIEVLLDRATAVSSPPEQLRLAQLLSGLSYHAAVEKRIPPPEYLAIASTLEHALSPDVHAEVASAYAYFPIDSVADRLLSIVADESQTPRTRLMAIRSIRLSKHNWPDSPHPETLGPVLRALVDTSPDNQIILAALWAEATLGTLDAATFDATLPKLIAADPSLENDDRVAAIRKLMAKR